MMADGVGYARTSTIDQSAGLAAQERDLRSAGAEHIFGQQVSSIAKKAYTIWINAVGGVPR